MHIPNNPCPAGPKSPQYVPCGHEGEPGSEEHLISSQKLSFKCSCGMHSLPRGQSWSFTHMMRLLSDSGGPGGSTTSSVHLMSLQTKILRYSCGLHSLPKRSQERSFGPEHKMYLLADSGGPGGKTTSVEAVTAMRKMRFYRQY